MNKPVCCFVRAAVLFAPWMKRPSQKMNLLRFNNMNLLRSIFVLTVLLSATPLNATCQQIVDDDFQKTNGGWHEFSLAGDGNHEIVDGTMNITASAGGSFAVYNSQSLSGHFSVDVDFEKEAQAGLALFRRKPDGTPDKENYSLIKISMSDKDTVVSVSDCQNGVHDVLDHTGRADQSRYRHVLNGRKFSLPFREVAGQLRILRHEDEGFLHFYYRVKKSVFGQEKSGWIELAPSKEWDQLDGDFLMGVVAFNGSAKFKSAKAQSEPKQDRNDRDTGFAATWREFNWNGYGGKALVVTFDKQEAPLSEGTRKFVFWESFNNVPAWYLDERLMYTYEFVETWQDVNDGPYEPMSDRLRRFSSVKLEHDGPDYKLVHWQYALLNPKYQAPDHEHGFDVPIVDEWYRIHPDGTVLRKVRYKPKLDTHFRSWHELTELILIGGSGTELATHLRNPAVTIWPIGGKRESFGVHKERSYENTHDDSTLMAVHVDGHPDLICAFNDNSRYATHPGHPITFYRTWHDANYAMSHWPINKEPYHTDSFKSRTTWTEQVKHISLAGAGVYGNGSEDWSSKVSVDPTDGREYREWISFVSLSPAGDLDSAKEAVEKWRENPW